MKIRPLILFGLATMLCGLSRAQTARFSGESLAITDGHHHLRIPNVIDPQPEYRVVHAIQKRGNDYYVVIGISEWSRGYPPKGGNCGCGIEEHIDWLHIRTGKILERQSGLHGSCLQNRYTRSIAWKRGVLQWSAKGSRLEREYPVLTLTDVLYSWTFDPKNPEKGIEEHSEDGEQRTIK